MCEDGSCNGDGKAEDPNAGEREERRSLSERAESLSEHSEILRAREGMIPYQTAQEVAQRELETGSLESRIREIEKQASIIRSELDSHASVGLSEMAELMSEGLTAQQAIDFLAVRRGPYGQTEWGEMTGERKRQSVQKNIERAELNLGL